MNVSVLWVVFTLIASGLSSPFILAVYTRRVTKRDKAEEHARADAVTAALLESNSKIAIAQADAVTETRMTLAAIHALVNSNLTEAQERELAATRAMLSSMREVITMKQDRGLEITQQTIDTLNEVELRITGLARDLRYKEEQTRKAMEALQKKFPTKDPNGDPVST